MKLYDFVSWTAKYTGRRMEGMIVWLGDRTVDVLKANARVRRIRRSRLVNETQRELH